MNLELKVLRVYNKEDLLNKLCELAHDMDADFVGFNGTECLREDAKEKGYTSNLDYVVEEIIKKRDYPVGAFGINQMCVDFLYEWLEKDSYYGPFDFNVHEIYYNEFVVSIVITSNIDY